MATKKKTTKKIRKSEPTLAPVPVVIVGYELDDQAIDRLIDMAFRSLERMLKSEHLIRAIHLYAQAQKWSEFGR